LNDNKQPNNIHMGRPKGSKNRPLELRSTSKQSKKTVSIPVKTTKHKDEYTIHLGIGVHVKGEDGQHQVHYPDARLIKR
jgi:hypothetical protein